MKITTTATTMTTTTDNKNIGSQYLAKYIRNVQQANEGTAAQYEYRLSRFEKYIATAYKEERHKQQDQELLITLDDVINELKKSGNDNNKINPYDLLSGFVTYLEEEEDIENPNTLRYFVITAANFLEYNDVEISPRKFKLKVRLPKPVIRYKEAISKEEIREILLKCSDIKLKTYLMLLASTGMRATEALALRFCIQYTKDNKSARHIQKKVWELPIPTYDPKNKLHIKLAELGKECAEKAEVILEHELKAFESIDAMQTTNTGILRKDIKPQLSEEMIQIDQIVASLLQQ